MRTYVRLTESNKHQKLACKLVNHAKQHFQKPPATSKCLGGCWPPPRKGMYGDCSVNFAAAPGEETNRSTDRLHCVSPLVWHLSNMRPGNMKLPKFGQFNNSTPRPCGWQSHSAKMHCWFGAWATSTASSKPAGNIWAQDLTSSYPPPSPPTSGCISPQAPDCCSCVWPAQGGLDHIFPVDHFRWPCL